MTQHQGALTQRVIEMLDEDLSLSKDIIDALRLAEIYADFHPEEFSRPITDNFQVFKPFELAGVFSPNRYG
ncbi:MAG: hypothetical protein RJA87_2002 [Pseudomonadota bacterium]|jgi:hypothetical protein